MIRKGNVKKTLLMSALSLVMCVSMLIGSTFAWFTDSVTSSNNKIQAGTLQIDLELLDKETKVWNSIKESKVPIFNYDKWEPGYTDVKILKVENEGTLALKWVAKFVSENDLTILSDVIDVYVCPSANELTYPADRDLTGYTRVGTVRDFVNTIKDTTYGNLKAGETAYLGIALKMQESAGNEYKDLPLGIFDIQILATQYTYEEDSFDEQYDADSNYPMGSASSLNKEFEGYEVAVKIPAEAPEYEYDLQILNYEFTNDKSVATLKFDMSLVDKNLGAIPSSSLEYPVKIQLPHPFVNMDNFQVLHNGEPVENATYDKTTRTISFTTTHFSPFEVKYIDYTEPSFALEYVDNHDGTYTITKGMFSVKNPAGYDPSLATADANYIAVDYVKDGVKYYVVSERASTVFVAADTTAEYVGENATFNTTNVDFKTGQSGKLWSLISGLQVNEHNTIYLLPGTYNEGTTINVYSSMDIIGLGDTDEVKVVKLSSSSSNRHLFNCNGTKADYIEITLRNLYLDATAKTTNSKDNAAVQSIRKTKVKCYDLTIVKGSGWDAVAFYVNGNNAVDGVKYPAYLYAENCSLNTTRGFGVVTTSGSYKFYHNNLTYGGTAYTNNSGSIKNKTMAANDWIWD